MRSTLLYILTIVLIINCSPTTKKGDSILNLVPNNTSILLKINDLESLKENLASNDILEQLESSGIYSIISKKTRPLNFLTAQKKGLVAFSANDSITLDVTFITPDSLSFINWDDFPNKRIETSSYKEATIVEYQIIEDPFYSTSIGDYHVLSSSKTILKTLIDNPIKERISQEMDKFYKVSNPTKSLNVWLDLEHGQPVLNQLFHSENKLSDFSSTIALDLTFNDTEILLNGIAQTNTQQNNFLTLFNDIKPTSNNISSLLPSDVTCFKSYSLDDFRLFSKNKRINSIEIAALDSLFNTVEEIGSAKMNNEGILVLRTFGTATLLDYLNEEKRSTEEYNGNEIWELPLTLAIFEPIEPLIGKPSFKYASVIENSFLFTESTEALQQLLTKYKGGDVFNKTDLYKNAANGLTSASNLLTISDLKGTTELLKASVSSTFSKTVEESGLKDYVFASQFIADDGFFHANFLIRKIRTEAERNTVSPVFDVLHSTDFNNLLQFVNNHNNRKKEIVVQDQENVLYLISSTGKILWQKQLSGTIQGKVHQVDLYKNGKLQLAFTTNNEFLILDRNGKEVAPFSMKFEGGNLNPLAVFDYESKKEYRFLVTQNEKVFMYNRDGQIVKGFKYTTAEASILEAPQHFRFGQKDYLIFKLANGQLKILNRVGNTRIAVKEKFSFSDNPIKPYQDKFTFTSTAGILYQIDTNGKITQRNVNLFKDHGMDATSRTLATMNDNVLTIRSKKIELELGVYSKPIIFYLNDKIYVSVTDIQNQRVYAFDSQAEAIPGFPIFGSSVIDMADIDNNGKPELVLKDQENSVRVYTIN